MPGTRTAPTINGTPTFIQLSVTLYDYTGEQRTDTYFVDADSTDAELEAYVAALQAVTNGTIWRVKVGYVYNSIGDSGNAIEEVWEDADSNLVVLLKSASIEKGQDWYVPAPINAMFVEGTNEIDPTNASLAAWLAAILPMRNTYSVVSARFTSRRDIGTKVNI
jgi:hypothetical protein